MEACATRPWKRVLPTGSLGGGSSFDPWTCKSGKTNISATIINSLAPRWSWSNGATAASSGERTCSTPSHCLARSRVLSAASKRESSRSPGRLPVLPEGRRDGRLRLGEGARHVAGRRRNVGVGDRHVDPSLSLGGRRRRAGLFGSAGGKPSTSPPGGAALCGRRRDRLRSVGGDRPGRRGASPLAWLLHRWVHQALGPILILLGMLFWGWIRLPRASVGFGGQFSSRVERLGLWAACRWAFWWR